MKRCKNCEHWDKQYSLKKKHLCRFIGVGYTDKNEYCYRFEKKKNEQMKLL